MSKKKRKKIQNERKEYLTSKSTGSGGRAVPTEARQRMDRREAWHPPQLSSDLRPSNCSHGSFFSLRTALEHILLFGCTCQISLSGFLINTFYLSSHVISVPSRAHSLHCPSRSICSFSYFSSIRLVPKPAI